MMKLDNLAILYKADKGSYWHNYCNAYEEYFGSLKNNSLRILEIGVGEGCSLFMWKDYFPNAQIVGMDCNAVCKKYVSDRIKIVIGMQGNVDLLTEINGKYGPFDIIIDDGSHRWDDQIISFQTLFPKLVGNGFYVVEDLHTSYDIKYCQSAKIPTVNYFKNIIDNINLFGTFGLKYNRGAREKSKVSANLDVLNHIESIRFHTSICFIKKFKVNYEKKRKIY